MRINRWAGRSSARCLRLCVFPLQDEAGRVGVMNLSHVCHVGLVRAQISGSVQQPVPLDVRWHHRVLALATVWTNSRLENVTKCKNSQSVHRLFRRKTRGSCLLPHAFCPSVYDMNKWIAETVSLILRQADFIQEAFSAAAKQNSNLMKRNCLKIRMEYECVCITWLVKQIPATNAAGLCNSYKQAPKYAASIITSCLITHNPITESVCSERNNQTIERF